MAEGLKMDAAAILAVREDEPERLFGVDVSALAGAFRALAKKWHPDLCAAPRAAEVFKHILLLHDVAEKRAANGGLRAPGVARFQADDGRVYEIVGAMKRNFELGKIRRPHRARLRVAARLRRSL